MLQRNLSRGSSAW